MKRSLLFQLCLVGASLLILLYVAFAPHPQREQPTRVVLQINGEEVIVGADGSVPAEMADTASDEEEDAASDDPAAGEPATSTAEPGMGALAQAAIETTYSPAAETNYNPASETVYNPAKPGTAQ